MQEPSLVGTLSTCPRCGSMIQIELPQERLIAGDSIDSQAITAEAEPIEGAITAPIGPGGFDPATVPPASEPIASPAPDPPAWQSARTDRQRQIALVVAISACSLLVAVTTFGWFVRSWHARKQASAAAKASVLGAVAGDAEAAAVEPDRLSPPESIPEASEPAAAPVMDPAATDGGQQAKADQAAESPGPPGDDAEEASSSEQAESVNRSPDHAPTSASKASEPPPSLLEPWRVDESSAPAGPVVVARGAETTDAEAGTMSDDRGTLTELPPGLAQFTPLLDLAASRVELQPTLEAPPTLTEIELESPAEESLDPMMIANPPEPIVLDKALAIQFAVDSPRYPLSDFVLVVSQISGVPVQIDWPSFDVASRDVAQRLPIPKGSMSASQMLEEVSALVGGVIRREESLVVLTLSDTVFDAEAQPVVSVEDLGDGAASAAALLEEFFRLEPDADVGLFTRLASREDKQLAALAVDAIRRMRGVEPKLAERSFSRWAAPAVTDSVEGGPIPGHWPELKDARPIEQPDAPESIAGLLRKLARVNDASCLVNWYDARRRRLSPEQLALPHSGRSGEAMLAHMLTPFRMQVRRVDSEHWWLGTEATYDRLPVIVWTEPIGERREEFNRRLATLARDDVGSDMRWVIDPLSDRGLLLVPRFVARQLGQLLAPTPAL